VGSVTFVAWDVGILYAMNHLLIFRISVAVGVLIGMLFIFDKESQDCARIIEKGLTK
jgi:hypothetical protein